MKLDNKKQIKNFINYICDWVEREYENKGHTGFTYNIRNDKMSYLIADKGIEKRIEKQLFKRLGFKAKVEYTLSPSMDRYSDGELKIRLLELIPIQMPVNKYEFEEVLKGLGTKWPRNCRGV